MWGIAVFFLFAFYNPANIAIDKMYWWYVVHLWVEGVWELVMASILAFLVIKLTGVDREVVEKWLYVIVGLALFSGILGTGHHYYWIGAPGYWQWIGSIFSTLEIAPFFTMVIFAFTMVWQGRRDHPNKAALLWSLGCTVVRLLRRRRLGLHAHAALGELLHATARRSPRRMAHLAFYGAYVDAEPGDDHLRHAATCAGVQPYNQVLNMWSFWIMTSAVVVHDGRADLRRRGADPSAARRWA